ncbi:MAG: hypothetical protein KW802_01130 [Candidatus Doudnabacteria bacterium]|nr:hypothetical protein [Candidatus Doudnabacteria bacterium]
MLNSQEIPRQEQEDTASLEAVRKQLEASEFARAKEAETIQKSGVKFENGPSDHLVLQGPEIIREKPVEVAKPEEELLSDETERFIYRLDHAPTQEAKIAIMNEVLAAKIPPNEANNLLEHIS